MAETMTAEEYRNRGKKPRVARTLPPAAPVGNSTENMTELVFMGKVPGMNGRDGLIRMGHRRKKTLRDRYQLLAMAQKVREHTGPVRVELIRHSIGRPMDYPNLVSTEKLLLDAIVLAKILPDDNNKVIVERIFTQTRALHRHTQMTVIRIIDL